MTTLSTLRRKLQKKKKHRPYGRCPMCGSRTDRCVTDVWWDETPDEKRPILVPRIVEECKKRLRWGCGWKKIINWSGGGTGRRIRHEDRKLP